jgi:hypothetical protein
MQIAPHYDVELTPKGPKSQNEFLGSLEASKT